MRGKVALKLLHKHGIWITPAHAGKRGLCTNDSPEHEDHPRTCGEKPKAEGGLQWRKGSPPHMRGKGKPVSTSLNPLRITPAHAGKSHKNFKERDVLQDHPRTCGEKFFSSLYIVRDQGSPPHMRGKAKAVVVHHVAHGITPAHAGKRSSCAQTEDNAEDHPRTCGEKTKKLRIIWDFSCANP